HQIPDISGIFSIHELLNDDKYEFEVAVHKFRFLLKTIPPAQYIITPPVTKLRNSSPERKKANIPDLSQVYA
ncbi:MAG: hypothetical protein ACYSU4_07520, partial [Planctomycetota bacterium]